MKEEKADTGNRGNTEFKGMSCSSPTCENSETWFFFQFWLYLWSSSLFHTSTYVDHMIYIIYLRSQLEVLTLSFAPFAAMLPTQIQR